MGNDNDTPNTAPPPRFDAVDADHDGATDRVGIDDNRDGKVDRDADVYVTQFGGANVKVAVLDVEVPPPPKVTIRDLLDRHGRDVEFRVRGELEPELREVNNALKRAKSLGARLWHAVVGGLSFTTVAYLLMAAYYGQAFWIGYTGGSAPAVGAPAERGAVYRVLREARDTRSDLWLVITADEADRTRVEAAMREDER